MRLEGERHGEQEDGRDAFFAGDAGERADATRGRAAAESACYDHQGEPADMLLQVGALMGDRAFAADDVATASGAGFRVPVGGGVDDGVGVRSREDAAVGVDRERDEPFRAGVGAEEIKDADAAAAEPDDERFPLPMGARERPAGVFAFCSIIF